MFSYLGLLKVSFMRFGRISPTLGLTTPPTWMDAVGVHVPSPKSKCRSICNTCRTILAMAKKFDQIFFGLPPPPPLLPLERCGSSRLDLSPLPCTSSKVVWHLFLDRWCTSWDCHTTAPALSRRAFQGYSNSSHLSKTTAYKSIGSKYCIVVDGIGFRFGFYCWLSS
jgi:hypothetical protein